MRIGGTRSWTSRCASRTAWPTWPERPEAEFPGTKAPWSSSWCNASGRFAAGLLPFVFLEMPLADADRLRRDFHQLVIGYEFHRVFQVQLDRRHEAHGFVGAGGAHVGELLALDRIHDQVVVSAVGADDHILLEHFAR